MSMAFAEYTQTVYTLKSNVSITVPITDTGPVVEYTRVRDRAPKGTRQQKPVSPTMRVIRFIENFKRIRVKVLNNILAVPPYSLSNYLIYVIL